jgi:hypothetical protein
LAPPPPPPLSPVSKLDRRHTGRLKKRDKLLREEGVGEEPNHKSYDGEKAWFSINPSILSGLKSFPAGLVKKNFNLVENFRKLQVR